MVHPITGSNLVKARHAEYKTFMGVPINHPGWLAPIAICPTQWRAIKKSHPMFGSARLITSSRVVPTAALNPPQLV